MKVKLDQEVEIATYCRLLEGEENQLESWVQSLGIHTKTTSSY